MWKPTLIASLVVLATLAPASDRQPLDERSYSMSLVGMYPHEDALIDTACDATVAPTNRLFATQAAICNEWRGPFSLRDFALWLQKTKLDNQLQLADAIWDNDPSFKHLPGSMHKLSLALRRPNPESVLVFAVDKTVTFNDVEAILKTPSATPAKEGPLVYGIEPVGLMPELVPKE